MWLLILGLNSIILELHHDDVIMTVIASQITSLTIIYSTVYSDADQRKHESSASLAFVWGIHRGPVNSPHKWPVTRKIFPFDDVIMIFLKVIVVAQNIVLLISINVTDTEQHFKYCFTKVRIYSERFASFLTRELFTYTGIDIYDSI